MKNSTALLPAERQKRILDILSQEFTARSSTLSDILGVSEMTIRRDFDILERKGLAERTHGGAVFKQERVAGKFQYRNSIKENLEEKQLIAKTAAALLEPNDVIFLGEGTNAALILKYLEPGFPCTIFTNNLGAIMETDHVSAELVLLGGAYNSVTHALTGPLTMQMIRQVNATKVFLGADALSITAGMTTPNFDIAIIDRCMIENTRGQVIVLANHTKFGLVAQMSIVHLKQIDVLITNQNIPDDFQNDLAQSGVDVLVG